jgi:hypothetical protein
MGLIMMPLKLAISALFLSPDIISGAWCRSENPPLT